MEVGEGIQEMIIMGSSTNEIRQKAIEEGMCTLRHSGLEKVKAGLTTLDEVTRETVKG